MDWVEKHALPPDASFDGGDLDCGNGLLLLIRKHLDPLQRGELLEVISTEVSVDEDLPAWARLTGNELLSRSRCGARRSFLICKGALHERRAASQAAARPSPALDSAAAIDGPDQSRPAPPVPPLAVLGIGSWPRPPWLLRSLSEYLEGRLPEHEFNLAADDAVRLAVAAQDRAGVDVLSDGEQRRDSYASFVGSRLSNCQLVPITDLLSYVDDPIEFERELQALDVPAAKVRHPAVLGRLARTRPLAVHELHFLRGLTTKPVKVALPGPYLLTRTMWLECISERVYQTREELAADVVSVLHAEIRALLDAGASLVQLDEPVLTEVVFGQPSRQRTFMCGALGARRDAEEELAFASRLLNAVVTGLPRERLALHICRGNWTPDESVALSGDYTPLVPFLGAVPVGVFLLELCTPRAGELRALAKLPEACRVGIGVVNPKSPVVESVASILDRAEAAIGQFGAGRVLLHPDCGFATFADNPVASAALAEAKLAAISQAAIMLRRRHRVTTP